MKQSWQIKKLGEVCNLYQPRTISGEMLVEDGKYLVYGANGIIGRYNEYNHENSEVLLTCRGATCGTINVSEPYSWINGNAMVVQPKNDNIGKTYLQYLLQTVDWGKVITGAAQPQITRQSLSPLDVIIPPREEQERIVAILDREFEKIDALKDNAEKNLQHAKDLFQSVLKQELQPKEGWITMKLGAFAHMKAGDFIKASDIKDEYFEGGYPCYGGNGLRGYVKEPNRNGEYCLIGRQGALCGNIRIANGVFRATEHAVVVSPYQKMPIKLIYYLLVALNLNQYSTGAAQPGLSVKNIADNVSISVPPQDIWNSVALRLGVIESNCKALEENYKKTIALCDDMKQALLRKAFNGEL